MQRDDISHQGQGIAEFVRQGCQKFILALIGVAQGGVAFAQRLIQAQLFDRQPGALGDNVGQTDLALSPFVAFARGDDESGNQFAVSQHWGDDKGADTELTVGLEILYRAFVGVDVGNNGRLTGRCGFDDGGAERRERITAHQRWYVRMVVALYRKSVLLRVDFNKSAAAYLQMFPERDRYRPQQFVAVSGEANTFAQIEQKQSVGLQLFAPSNVENGNIHAEQFSTFVVDGIVAA